MSNTKNVKTAEQSTETLLEQCYADAFLYIAVIGAYREFCKQKGLEQESVDFIKAFLKDIETKSRTAEGGVANG